MKDWEMTNYPSLITVYAAGLAWTAHRVKAVDNSRAYSSWRRVVTECGKEFTDYQYESGPLSLLNPVYCDECFKGGIPDFDGWNSLSSYTPPKNVRVLMVDGSVIEPAHFAWGGGEDQPFYHGWFEPCESGYTQIDQPIAWQEI